MTSSRPKLADAAYRRVKTQLVSVALRDLATEVPKSFREFYEIHVGPFGSSNTGFLLLDLIQGNPNILSMTKTCRQEFGWHPNLLVLTEPVANAVLTLDATRDLVFNVDFEGGDLALLSGALAPTWESFSAFLDFFFGD